MVDVRFELTTNDPWSVDDAICEGISPLGYWQEVNQSPTQTKPYNTLLPTWYQVPGMKTIFCFLFFVPCFLQVKLYSHISLHTLCTRT